MNSIEDPTPAPALWNPGAAASWSLIFSPAFGAYIHARNAEVMGRTEEAKANRLWFYGSLGYLVLVSLSVFVPSIPDAVFRGAAIGLLVGWYFAQGNKQVQHVKNIYENSYQHKPWGKPLGIALGCFIGFIVIIIMVGAVVGLFASQEQASVQRFRGVFPETNAYNIVVIIGVVFIPNERLILGEYC